MHGTPAAQLVQRAHTAFQNSLIVLHPVDALVFRRLVFEAQDGIPRRIVQAPAKTVGKAFEIAVERRAALDVDDVDLLGGATGALPGAMPFQTAFFCCAAVHEVQTVQIGGTGRAAMTRKLRSRSRVGV